ncbi:MAG: hypothetical protein IJ305_01960 [Oscillospiraceae bacterium]|nr:hypothetical protein [Oscillospiraceae bacterium]
MKKVLKVTLITLLSVVILGVAVVISAVVAILLKPAERTTGVYQEKGGDVLYITNQYGDDSEFTVLKNDNILEFKGTECWKPINEGKCVFVEDWYDYPYYYRGSTVYEISVDENLKISFEEREVFKYSWDMLSDGDKIIIERNNCVIPLSQEKRIEVREKLDMTYYDSVKCDTPDLTGAVRVTSCYDDDKIAWELFVTQDRIYEYSTDENGNITEWYENIPIEGCDLERINKLLRH